MRRLWHSTRLLSLSIAVLPLFAHSVTAQGFEGAPAAASSPDAAIQRDPQALEVLAKAVTAAGGSSLLNSIQDSTGTGTITYQGSTPVTGTATVKTRGLQHLKIDATLPTGRRTTVISGSDGSTLEENATIKPIHRENTPVAAELMAPYLLLLAATNDSSVGLAYSGLVIHNGISVYDLQLVRSDPARRDPLDHKLIQKVQHFYIDAHTFAVTAVSDRLYPGSLRDEGIPHEIQYSNYQSQSGVTTPLTITELIRGVASFTVNLTQVTFNSGLTDSDLAQR